MATHSSILNWRIPWTEELGGLQSMGVQRVGHDWATNTFTFHFQQVWMRIVLVKLGYIATLVQLKCIQFFFLKKQNKTKTFLFHSGAYPINSVVIVSGGQQRDKALHIYVSILPQTFLPSRLLHNTEQISLCHTVGPCWLSISNIAVCSCLSQTP